MPHKNFVCLVTFDRVSVPFIEIAFTLILLGNKKWYEIIDPVLEPLLAIHTHTSRCVHLQSHARIWMTRTCGELQVVVQNSVNRMVMPKNYAKLAPLSRMNRQVLGYCKAVEQKAAASFWLSGWQKAVRAKFCQIDMDRIDSAVGRKQSERAASFWLQCVHS